nr:hypothetical protein [Tanacetum cinerariifolium]
LKARGTLLMALPDKHQLKFNIHKDAKTLIETIEKSTNDPVSGVASVSVTSAKILVFALPNVDTLSNAVIYSFFASKSNSPQLDNDDLKQINADDLKEMDLNGEWPLETSTSNALVSQCDGVGSYDWSFQAEEEPTNYALMAFTSSSSSSFDNEVPSCSKACTKAYATLQSHYDKLTDDFRKSQFDVISYKTGIEYVEDRLLVYQQNEYVFEEDIKLLKLEVQLRDNALVVLRQKFEKAEQERDDLKLKLEKYQSGDGYHVVPLPYTGTFMPPQPDLVFHDAPNVNKTDHTAFNVELSPTKPDKDLSHIHKPSVPITEDWVSDSEDDSEAEILHNNSSFLQPTEQVKAPRPSVKTIETSIPAANHKTAIPNPKRNGNRRNRKACFVMNSPTLCWRFSMFFSGRIIKLSHKPSKALTQSLRETSLVEFWEEVYVCQPPGFEDPDYPDKIYVDDIIFGSTNKDLCKAFEKLMKDKFQMSSKGELTFFLGLQVKQKQDRIFISQDKYVAEILRKFGLTDRKSASTLRDTEKPLLKDPGGEDVEVHTYISMIGSLMYLTSLRPDIVFAVYACACFQYPKDSLFNLVAYSDSDYAGARLDRKSTTWGCQFLRCRLISWQCKKQTIVAISSTEAEAQVGDLSSHSTKYSSPALTQKVIANIRRVGKCFSKVDKPLFEGMIVVHQDDDITDEGAASVAIDDVHVVADEPSIPSPTPTTQPPPPSQDIPSTSQGRIIASIDADVDVTLKDVADIAKEVTLDAEIEESADVQGSAARRRKGVVIRDPEKIATPSIIIHFEAKSKDKGKGILVEEPKPLKKQAQIDQDEAYAKENMDGFKMDYFKGMTYDDIHPIFEKKFNSNVAFLEKIREQMKEEDSKALKRKSESQAEKEAKKHKLDEEKFNSNVAFLEKIREQMKEEDSKALKRKSESQAEKEAKKQKLDEEVDELKRHL